MQPRRDIIPIFCILVPLIVLFGAGNVAGIKYLWGFNFFKFLPPLFGLVAVALVLISSVPVVSRRLVSPADSPVDTAGTVRANVWKFLVPFSAAMLGLFLLFPSATTLLGDGTLRVNQIGGGQTFLSTEILDFYLHTRFHSLIFRPLDLTVNQSYQVFAALCGVVFIVGLFRLAAYVNGRQPVTTFLLMFSSGLTVLFFGYIESYSLIAALLPYIIQTGLQVIDGSRTKKRFVIWYIVAGLVHVVALIILSGMLFAVLSSSANDDRQKSHRASLYALAAIAAGLVLIYVAVFLNLFGIGYYFLPLLPRPEFQQGILTADHYLNLLNWLLLVSLPFLLLAGITFAGRNLRHAFTSRKLTLGYWMMIPPLLFMFFFTPQLGGPRDWDLFTLPAFMLVPASLIIYFDRRERRLPPLVLPAILMALLTTAAFAAVNSRPTTAADRCWEIIDVSRFKNMFREYGTLFTHSERHPELTGRRLEFALKAWSQPPYTNEDSVYILQKLGEIYTQQKNAPSAWQYLTLAYQADTLNLLTHVLMMNYLNTFGTVDDITRMAYTIEGRFPDNPTALVMVGLIYIRNGDTARGEAQMDKAISINASDFNALVNYGTYMLGKKDYEKARELLMMALVIDRKNFLANYYLAITLMEQGDLDRAEEYLAHARKYMTNKREVGMVADLTGDINYRRVSLPGNKDGS